MDEPSTDGMRLSESDLRLLRRQLVAGHGSRRLAVLKEPWGYSWWDLARLAEDTEDTSTAFAGITVNRPDLPAWRRPLLPTESNLSYGLAARLGLIGVSLLVVLMVVGVAALASWEGFLAGLAIVAVAGAAVWALPPVGASPPLGTLPGRTRHVSTRDPHWEGCRAAVEGIAHLTATGAIDEEFSHRLMWDAADEEQDPTVRTVAVGLAELAAAGLVEDNFVRELMVTAVNDPSSIEQIAAEVGPTAAELRATQQVRSRLDSQVASPPVPKAPTDEPDAVDVGPGRLEAVRADLRADRAALEGGLEALDNIDRQTGGH